MPHGDDLEREAVMSNQSVSVENSGRSVIWTVYRHPNDYPNCWVMRAHEILPGVGSRPDSFCFVAKTLDEIRAKVPPGARCVGREASDNPAIYESWLTETFAPHQH